MAKRKPSLSKEFLKACLSLFWTWLGFDALAEDFESHENTVKKANVLRFVAVLCLIAGISGYLIKGCVDSPEVQRLHIQQSTDSSLLESYKKNNSELQTENTRLHYLLEDIKLDSDPSARAVKKRALMLAVQIGDFDLQYRTNFPSEWRRVVPKPSVEETEKQYLANSDKALIYEAKEAEEFNRRFMGRIQIIRDQIHELGFPTPNIDFLISNRAMLAYRPVADELQKLADQIKD